MKSKGAESVGIRPRNASSQQKPEGHGQVFSGAVGGSVALPSPCLWTHGLQNCERIHFCCFRPPVCVVVCCGRHRKLKKICFWDKQLRVELALELGIGQRLQSCEGHDCLEWTTGR